MTVFSRIRSAARRVAEEASSVTVDDEALAALARSLVAQPQPPGDSDPVHAGVGDSYSTLCYVMTLDAVNFGSGWFPLLNKRPGCSGYFTIANSLRDYFVANGPLDSQTLRTLHADDCALIFGQSTPGTAPAVRELVELFTQSLRDLGDFLHSRFDGDFGELIRSADRRAERLILLLDEMPLYRDVSKYRGFDVPFYKRAQITAMDLALALGGKGLGRFDDLGDLTMFADNLVPHVLRQRGVLSYSPALASRIERGELLAAGSVEEVEIRAVGLYAVESMVEIIRAEGGEMIAGQLDQILWTLGQSPEMKARPRHRCRSYFY